MDLLRTAWALQGTWVTPALGPPQDLSLRQGASEHCPNSPVHLVAKVPLFVPVCKYFVEVRGQQGVKKPQYQCLFMCSRRVGGVHLRPHEVPKTN